jgi:phage-related protein (TIGR01555 family)
MIKWLLNRFFSPVQQPTGDKHSPIGFFSTDTAVREAKLKDYPTILKQTFRQEVNLEPLADAIGQDSMANLGESVKLRFGNNIQGLPDVQLSWYAAQGFIGYQACAMLAQQAMIDKVCTIPGEDAIRNGYAVTLDGGIEADAAFIEAYRLADERHHIQRELEEFVRMSRVFGVRHALFKVQSSDPNYYEYPFNPDAVTRGSYEGVVQIDPIWITPELDSAAVADPASKHFYEPTYWRINGKRYHRSHFVIIRNSELPTVLRPSYVYGGISLPQKIYERVYAAERCANEAPQLLLTKRSTVIHVDMEKVVANPAKFEEKITEWIYFRDNYGIKAVGKEEVIEQFDTALVDLDATIMTQYQLVAAIAQVPATKLLGTTPKGFNATGEYDEASYHEFLRSIQAHKCTPFLQRHHLLVMRSEVAPKLGMTPVGTGVRWAPLDTPTAKELAETNLIKSQTGQALVNSGAIDGMDERQRITADPDSGYTGLPEVDDETPPPVIN